MAQSQAELALADATELYGFAGVLESSGRGILTHFDTLKTQCPEDALATFKDDEGWTSSHTLLNDYLERIKEYKEFCFLIVKTLKPLQDAAEHLRLRAAACLFWPVVFISLCCLVVFVPVMATASIGGPTMAHINDVLFLKLLAPTIGLAVISAALASSTVMATGTAAAAFCHEADKNVLAYAGHALGKDSFPFKVTEYYLKDTGKDPFDILLSDGEFSLAHVETKMSSLQMKFGMVWSNSCKWNDGPSIIEEVRESEDALEQSKPLVSRDKIYPYYNEVVHKAACRTVLHGFGWLIACLILVGLCMLPLLALWSANFYGELQAWKNRSDNAMLQEDTSGMELTNRTALDPDKASARDIKADNV